jgi:hypothetical protein
MGMERQRKLALAGFDKIYAVRASFFGLEMRM